MKNNNKNYSEIVEKRKATIEKKTREDSCKEASYIRKAK